MLSKLTARVNLLLDQTSRYPVARVILARPAISVYRQVAVLAAFSLLGTVLVWPIFGADYPPGVDTATFLHLSWVTELAVSGQLADPFQDPYWYGGFPYLAAYPPLGYGLVGVVSFLTGLDFVNVYTSVLVLAYGGLAAATYWLALEFGLKRWAAVLAGVLVALAYPVLSSIFLWGWFTSVAAMPFALVGLMLLERSLRTGNSKLALLGGVSMAVSILVHHMTGLSMGLGMAGWFLFNMLTGMYPRRRLVLYSAVFVGIMVLVVVPWGIPFLVHVLDVGFRREVPGLWRPEFSMFRTNIGDSSLIGEHVYPSYLGITLMVLATGGTVLALIERRRFAGLAVGLLVLLWFSLGADMNPLIRAYPFSALDTARFHLFIAPFLALMAGFMAERILQFAKEVGPDISPRLWTGTAAVMIAAIVAFPAVDAWKARDFMAPYEVHGSVSQAIAWLADNPPEEESPGSVYSVGLWTWHTFLIPLLADRPLIDGWHDEGAGNVKQIRQLRLMGWTANVDVQEAHRLLTGQGARYVLVNRMPGFSIEASDVFWKEFEAHPSLFTKSEQWGDVAIFRVLN